ncbi:MAG: hypothetical protein WCW13_03520 [archaeon]|jgi:hypothetical protein
MKNKKLSMLSRVAEFLWMTFWPSLAAIMVLIFLWVIVAIQNPSWIGNENFVMGIETGLISGIIVYAMIKVDEKLKKAKKSKKK